MKKLLLTLATFAATCFGIQAGNVTFDFKQIDFKSWNSSYSKRVVTYPEGTVTFASAGKQNSGQTIDDMPVTKGNNVTFVIKDSYAPITSAKLTCKQWGTKAQKISVSTSTDGTTFTLIEDLTSENFVLDVTTVPEGTVAVQFSFSNNSNQVGIQSLEIGYAGEGGSTDPETPENPDPEDPETPDTHDGDYLTAESLNLGGSYNNFTEKEGKSGAVYAGNAMKNSANAIQLRGKSNSGIVSTTSGGYIRTINVKWDSSTQDGRKLDVYGKNEPYTAAEDLYSEQKAGELLGTIEKGTLQFTVDGNYQYVGVRSNADALYLDYIEFVWGEAQAEPSVALPVITSAEGEEGVVVTIACETKGAAIYYTLDGNEPTADSEEYTEPFSIYDTVTVKAIAIKGEDASRVATETIKVIPSVPSLIAFVDFPNGKEFRFTADLTVIYSSGAYNYVIDADKNNGLIYMKNLGVNAGDVIKGGWLGKVTIHNGLFELVPQEELTIVKVEEGTEFTPTPIIINAANANEIDAKNQNMYVKIYGLVISAPETRATATTAFLGDTEVALYPQFADVEIPTAAGTYNVTGFISVYNTVQVLPTAFEQVTEVAAPTFSQAGGKYEDTIEITLACATEEADIYYSVDGSEPTTLYTPGEKIAINQADMVVKAVAQLGNVKSEVVSESYTILSLGVDFVAADNDAEYYTVSGVKVNNAAVAPGLYIRVNNGKAQKVIIRK